MELRRQVIAILEQAQDLTIATLRSDGYPQATTVSFASEGLNLYFACGSDSQKARNLARDPRVSLTVNLPYADWSEIRGLSMSGRADRLLSSDSVSRASDLLVRKFPQGIAEYASGPLTDIAFFRILPEVISVIDYREGFGHTELVTSAELQSK